MKIAKRRLNPPRPVDEGEGERENDRRSAHLLAKTTPSAMIVSKTNKIELLFAVAPVNPERIYSALGLERSYSAWSSDNISLPSYLKKK